MSNEKPFYQCPQSLRYTQLAQAIANTAQHHVWVSQHDHDSDHWLQVATCMDPSLKAASFPHWDTLAYDPLTINPHVISTRLATLRDLIANPPNWLFTSLPAASTRLCPRTYLQQSALTCQVGQVWPKDRAQRAFAQAQYQRVDQVLQPGEYAVRGCIIDVFVMGAPHPLRIEWFDDTIESLRTFDVDSQRSTASLKTAQWLPSHEYALDEHQRDAFRKRWRDTFEGNPNLSQAYRDLSQGNPIPGAEYYLPLMHHHLDTLHDYLSPKWMVYLPEGSLDQITQLWAQRQHRYQQRSAHLCCTPESLFIDSEAWQRLWANYPKPTLATPQANLASPQPGSTLPDWLQWAAQQPHAILCVSSASRYEHLRQTLQDQAIPFSQTQTWAQTHTPGLYLLQAPFLKGFIRPDGGICLTEAELLNQTPQWTAKTTPSATPRSHTSPTTLSDLSLLPGDFVIHQDHGLGQYLGLETVDLHGQTTELVSLAYADGDRLLVPTDELDALSVYWVGSEQTPPPLSKLGSKHWQQQKEKAQTQMVDMAAQLLSLAAKRANAQGHAFPIPEDYRHFQAEFPYEETPDQARAIEAVCQDLAAPHPMDRLVCGDVGFGKTEVAMRAAFVVAQNHHQVAVLVPTTLLANQHLQSFRHRFAHWPLRIESLSREREGTAKTQLLADLSEGKVDILIGTHALLQPLVIFKNLGLLIIDEEHRFGVKHKEMLKAKRADVDVLSLSATPIPRTLHFSLSHLRDLSLITTPPKQRLPVQTLVRIEEPDVFHEALSRELQRGGQAYICCNDIKQLPEVSRQIQALLPTIRVAYAHGKMTQTKLQTIMLAFYQHQIDVLIASTIIESGLDVGNANTIIIMRADRLGLSQLHQLRGRVGRSHHQAYAYLLTPESCYVSVDAAKRLDAMTHTSSIGAGFELAMHDLEIRGAGELLGKAQSGHMHTIGQSLYLRMLEEVTQRLRRGEPIPDGMDWLPKPQTILDCRLSALIPDDYLPDVSLRLKSYAQLARIEDAETLELWGKLLRDRFGPLPEVTQTLMAKQTLTLFLKNHGFNDVAVDMKICQVKRLRPHSLNMNVLMTQLQDPLSGLSLKQGDTLLIERPDHLSDAQWLRDIESRLMSLTPVSTTEG